MQNSYKLVSTKSKTDYPVYIETTVHFKTRRAAEKKLFEEYKGTAARNNIPILEDTTNRDRSSNTFALLIGGKEHPTEAKIYTPGINFHWEVTKIL